MSHSYKTRRNATFQLPNVKSQGAKTFRFNGIKLWNSLPTNIKEVDNKVSFKIKCKSFLADKMKNKEDNVYVM